MPTSSVPRARTLLAAALAAGLGACSLSAAQAPPAAPPLVSQVPTTRVLAIGRLTAPAPSDRAALRGVMPEEVRATVDLYLAGKLDQWFVRQDGKGVVFLLNASSTEEAAAALSKLPLVVSHRMEFDLMPLGPLSPLRYLMGEAPGAPRQ